MKTWVKSLEVSDGYLRNAPISLAEGLTCIIGARGTCKSTIIETIRFVHDIRLAKVEMLREADSTRSVGDHGGLLQETLGSGIAACTIHIAVDGRSSEVRLERSLNTSSPRIYRDGVLDTMSSPEGLDIPIEIYSQGDLIKIAENPRRRLQLVDRPHLREIGQIVTRLRSAQDEVVRLSGEISTLRASIREDHRSLSQLSELEAQLEAVQHARPTLDPHLEKQRAEYEAREQLLVLARSACEDFSKSLALATPVAPRTLAAKELGNALETTGIEHGKLLARHLRELADSWALLDQQLVLVHTRVAQVKESVQALSMFFEQRNQEYRKLRHDQDALSASLEQEDRIRAQLRRMQELRDSVAQRQVVLEKWLLLREERRKDIECCFDAIYQLRLREIEKISIDLGGDISLAIVQGGQYSIYTEAIFKLLGGTRLKRQPEIAMRISELLTPAELVDIVEQEQASRLAALANLEELQASRIINHFLDNMASVLDLEKITFDDHLEIKMNIDGEVRPIEQLSRGQMATALLPLILRTAEFPLVFDQPEDDLDNRFIFDKLVAKVRELKLNRQLIFVTHNANIPVLGDADLVIAMSMATARVAAPPATGSIDDMRKQILDILEGGAAAFQERRRRYKGII